MTKNETEVFIEEMESIGDIWEPEDVERVYGDKSLEDSIEDRKSQLNEFFNIIGTVINGEN